MSPHFPYECSDEELQEKIAEYAERVQSSGTTGTLQWWPLLQLGLIEQQNRQTRRSNTTSRRVVHFALVASIASLLFTGVGVLYVRQAARSSERQIEMLEAVRQEAAGVRASIEKLQAAMAPRSGPPRAEAPRQRR
jgi:hypothetical protein